MLWTTILLAAFVAGAGCGSSKPPEQIVVEPTQVRDVHPALMGTIGAEADLRGAEPALISGLGLVVGLNGTGGGPLDDRVAATMERLMGLQGIGRSTASPDGRPTSAIDGRSPRQLLRDPNVAVVLVQAAIPPGSPEGTRFDVLVQAVNATSLEGGLLWTTDLSLGPPAVFGAVQTRRIAVARGPVFINPFSEPGREETGVRRTIGRILDGGVMRDPLGIELALLNDSHARARSIVNAINSRFPPGAGDQRSTARGRTGSSIELRVPGRYRENPGEFIELVRYLRMDPSMPEEAARRYAQTLVDEPAMANDMAWALEAVGERALPFVRELYTHPDPTPRLAALRVGARLGDPRSAEPLMAIAQDRNSALRADAVTLLARVDGGPRVDMGLRDLLSESDLVVRIAAYESLARRAERGQLARLAAQQARSDDPTSPQFSASQLEELSKLSLPRGTLQGIERRLIAGKFFLDLVPAGEPMIYITQQGRPRVVVFGENPSLTVPSVMSAWSDRLMMSVEPNPSGSGPQAVARVYYRPLNSERAFTHTAPTTLPELVEYLARKSEPEDPRPGLNLSYSEVVGVLHALYESRMAPVRFATERDRLRAQTLAAERGMEIRERPEKPGEDPIVLFRAPTGVPMPDPESTPTEAPRIIPIAPPGTTPR